MARSSYEYVELMTPEQWFRISEQMRVFWGGKWELDEDDYETWYRVLSQFPGVFVWRGVKGCLYLEWPPELGQLVGVVEELYAPFAKLERLLGIRDEQGERLPAGEIQKRLAR